MHIKKSIRCIKVDIFTNQLKKQPTNPTSCFWPINRRHLVVQPLATRVAVSLNEEERKLFVDLTHFWSTYWHLQDASTKSFWF